MILTEIQRGNMKEAAKPLVKWLNDNCHPHVKVIVDPSGAEVLEGLTSVAIEEFWKD